MDIINLIKTTDSFKLYDKTLSNIDFFSFGYQFK